MPREKTHNTNASAWRRQHPEWREDEIRAEAQAKRTDPQPDSQPPTVVVGNCPECDAPIGDGFGCPHWPDSQPGYTDEIEYDERAGHLIATNRLAPDEYGASAIVARDVHPAFARRVLAAAESLARAELDGYEQGRHVRLAEDAQHGFTRPTLDAAGATIGYHCVTCLRPFEAVGPYVGGHPEIPLHPFEDAGDGTCGACPPADDPKEAP